MQIQIIFMVILAILLVSNIFVLVGARKASKECYPTAGIIFLDPGTHRAAIQWSDEIFEYKDYQSINLKIVRTDNVPDKS